MPGANPCAAASAIRRGSLCDGSDGMKDTDSDADRAPSAAATSRPPQAITISAATGRAVGRRVTKRRAREGASAGSDAVLRSGALRVLHRGAALPRTRAPNSRGPGHRQERGTSVTQTTVTTARGDGEAGSEHAEEVQPAREQRERPRDDERPSREHERPDPRGGGAGRLDAGGAAPQARARLGHEEHGVVGDEPEQQHDEHRLDLVGHPVAGLLAAPRQRADRDDVAERRGRERHERRADRAEVQRDDEQDDEHRRGLHPRQRPVDLVPLRAPRGSGAADAPLAARRQGRQGGEVVARRT